jgi:hypothetical protein
MLIVSDLADDPASMPELRNAFLQDFFPLENELDRGLAL